ncbi:Metallo-hydrolase/oxidoreductase [Sarocladium strictum]
MESSPFTEKAKPGVVVEVHALSAGHFTLPEHQFISPCEDGARKLVPSLCFLVHHRSPITNKTTRIVFDLGLRRDVKRYAEPIRKHTETRQPMTIDPDVVKSLGKGGLTPDDIDYVIYSHVHWDHIGEPRDFPKSKFVVGHGSLDLLAGVSSTLRGGHSFFEADLLDPARTISCRNPSDRRPPTPTGVLSQDPNFSGAWKPFGHLKNTIDLFQDGSMYIVDAPGHLPGHINLLARTEDFNGGKKWVYLAGDACHDRRIMRKEREIGEWLDAHGHVCCIHADRKGAEATIESIRMLEEQGVEVILAHDVEWENDKRNANRYFDMNTSHLTMWFLTNEAHFICSSHPPHHARCWRGVVLEWRPTSREDPRNICNVQICSCWQTSLSMEAKLIRSNRTLGRISAMAEDSARLRQEFIASMGEPNLHEGWESILKLDPTIFKTSLSLASVPRKKRHLLAKEQALIGLAVSANATHLYVPGIRTHVEVAIKEGATIHEVLEVIELSSTLGIHACNIGIPLLVEVLKEEGKFEDLTTRDFDDKQNELKKQFTQRRGYWHNFWEDFLRLDPEFFEAYLEFSGAPWIRDVGKDDDPPRGALSPKMKEFVYCAFDTAATHLYVPGLRLHMKNALGYGATPQEMVEVIEIATLLSLHTVHVSAPIITELFGV